MGRNFPDGALLKNPLGSNRVSAVAHVARFLIEIAPRAPLSKPMFVNPLNNANATLYLADVSEMFRRVLKYQKSFA